MGLIVRWYRQSFSRENRKDIWEDVGREESFELGLEMNLCCCCLRKFLFRSKCSMGMILEVKYYCTPSKGKPEAPALLPQQVFFWRSTHPPPVLKELKCRFWFHKKLLCLLFPSIYLNKIFVSLLRTYSLEIDLLTFHRSTRLSLHRLSLMDTCFSPLYSHSTISTADLSYRL